MRGSEKKVIIVNRSFIHGEVCHGNNNYVIQLDISYLALASVLTPVLHKSSKLICILIKSVVEENFCILHVLVEEQN